MDHAARAPVSLNRLAARATTHCLIGCGIGEVLGVVIGTALGWTTATTILLAVALAFVFGYGLTIWPLVASGLALRAALALAFVADTVSITVMEIVDNAILLLIPGAMEASLGSPLFWSSLAVALAIAWVVTLSGEPMADRSRPRPRSRARRPLTIMEDRCSVA